MKLFKDEDGLLEALSRLATVLAFAFGVYVYFNSVRPIFEKTVELESAKAEVQELQETKATLTVTNGDLTTERNALREEIAALAGVRDQLNDTQGNLEERESLIKELLSQSDSAGHYAVLAHLERISDRIRDAYLASLAVQSKFELAKEVETILQQERDDIDNSFKRAAVEFFEVYISDHLPAVKSKDEIISFFVGLPFEYRTEQFEAQLK